MGHGFPIRRVRLLLPPLPATAAAVGTGAKPILEPSLPLPLVLQLLLLLLHAEGLLPRHGPRAPARPPPSSPPPQLTPPGSPRRRPGALGRRGRGDVSGGRRGVGRRGCKRRHVRAVRAAPGCTGRRAGDARGRPEPTPSRALPSGSRGRGRGGGKPVSSPPGAPGSCHSPGGGRARGRGHAPPRGRPGRMAPGRGAEAAPAVPRTGLRRHRTRRGGGRRGRFTGVSHVRARVRRGKRAGRGLRQRGQRAQSCGWRRCCGNRGDRM